MTHEPDPHSFSDGVEPNELVNLHEHVFFTPMTWDAFEKEKWENVATRISHHLDNQR
jgi:hypothetical protein